MLQSGALLHCVVVYFWIALDNMKTIKILLLVSILAVTQSFAFSKTQKNILLGIGAGAIIIHALESHSNNRYEKSHKKILYEDSRYSHRKHKKHHVRKHYTKNYHARHHNNRGHRHYSHANYHNKHYYRSHRKRGYSRY